MDLSQYRAKSPTQKNPNGLSLERHTNDVVFEISQSHFWSFADKIFGAELVTEIKSAAVSAAMYHDYGKAHLQWQSKMKENKLYEAKFRHELASILMKWDRYKPIKECCGLINSNDGKTRFDQNWILLSEAIAVAAHHSKLNRRSQSRFQELNAYVDTDEFKVVSGELKTFKNNCKEDLGLMLYDIFYNMATELGKKKVKFEADGRFKFVLMLNFLRSTLHLADISASAREEGRRIPTVPKFSYKFPEKWESERRKIQKSVKEISIDQNLCHVIWATTGSGKTQAALELAMKYIEKKQASKVAIFQPTQFVTNSLYTGIKNEEVLQGLEPSDMAYALVHGQSKHHLRKEKEEKFSEDDRFEQTMMDNFNAPVIVGTIDQLILSFSMIREKHRMRLLNLADSVLVFDEFDYYNEFLMQNMKVVLTLCKEMSIPVIFMSATFNKRMVDIIERLGYGMPKIIKDETNNNVNKCIISKKGYAEFCISEDVFSEVNYATRNLLFKSFNYDSAVIYANTVAGSIAYYEALKKEAEHRSESIKIILYHSYFTPEDRKVKEEEILNNLGKEEGRQRTHDKVIVVMTQIGEMSINISCDYMVSDLCPIDRLIQRAGRLNRFDDSQLGELSIIRTTVADDNGDKSDYPYPYVQNPSAYNVSTGEEIMRNPIQPGYLNTLSEIESLLSKKESVTLTYGDLQKINEAVYENVETSVEEAAHFESEKLEQIFREHMLMNIRKGDSKESEGTEELLEEERNHMPRGFIMTTPVYTTLLQDEFKNSIDFSDLTSDNTVSVGNNYMSNNSSSSRNRLYLIEHEIVVPKTVVVGEQQKSVYLLSEKYQKSMYDKEYGFGRVSVMNRRVESFQKLIPAEIRSLLD